MGTCQIAANGVAGPNRTPAPGAENAEPTGGPVVRGSPDPAALPRLSSIAAQAVLPTIVPK